MENKYIPAQGCVHRGRPLSPFYVPKPTGEDEFWWGQVSGDYDAMPGDPAWFCSPAANQASHKICHRAAERR